jgi:hypothetical protein
MPLQRQTMAQQRPTEQPNPSEARAQIARGLRYLEAAHAWLQGELWWSGFVSGSGPWGGFAPTRGHQTKEFVALQAAQMDALWEQTGGLLGLDPPWRLWNLGQQTPSYASAPQSAVQAWTGHLDALAAWAATWGPNQDGRSWSSYLAVESDDQTIARFASECFRFFGLASGDWAGLAVASQATWDAGVGAITDWGEGGFAPLNFEPPADVVIPLPTAQALGEGSPQGYDARRVAAWAGMVLQAHRANPSADTPSRLSLQQTATKQNPKARTAVVVVLGLGLAGALAWALLGA